MAQTEMNQMKTAVWQRVVRIWRTVSVPITAVLLAIGIGAIILIISGASPLEAYTALYNGSFGSEQAFSRTLSRATPLLLNGLAVAFAFKAGLFNIGAQGQLLFGAVVAAYAGFTLTGLPPTVHITLSLLLGALAGAAYGFIPGILKTYTGAHEVITTIMLNFVAINITDYLADGPWKDTSPGNIVARTPRILPSAEISTIGPSLPIGFFIAVGTAVFIWWLLYRTTIGYEIRTVGLNPPAAHYAGIHVSWIIVLTMLISGFLAGMGGAIETQGVVGRFQPGFNTGLGFDGITIALLARTHPIGVIPAALLIGAMEAGASQMQFRAGVPNEIIGVIQALILFFVTADMLVRWIIRTKKSPDEEQITLSTGWGQH